jgi:hypothetical protein
VRDHLRRTRLAAIGLALGTALLTGCAGATAEAPSESLPSTSSPAPTTEALPVVGPADFPVPVEARTKDAAGAEAFLRYWIDLINRQQAIPAGQPLRDLGPECQECNRIAQVFDEAAAQGHRYEGGLVTIKDVPAPIMGDGTARFSFSVSAESERLVDATGAEVAPPLTAEPLLFCGMDVSWSPPRQAWVVTNFGIG